jgi:hypothetical protein
MPSFSPSMASRLGTCVTGPERKSQGWNSRNEKDYILFERTDPVLFRRRYCDGRMVTVWISPIRQAVGYGYGRSKLCNMRIKCCMLPDAVHCQRTPRGRNTGRYIGYGYEQALCRIEMASTTMERLFSGMAARIRANFSWRTRASSLAVLRPCLVSRIRTARPSWRSELR